jgi:hypothetical protein
LVDSGLLIWAPGFADSEKDRITGGSIFFQSSQWSEVHGKLKRKPGKSYYTLRLTDDNGDGKIVYKGRVPKNDPTTIQRIRVTITDFEGEGCTVRANGD